MASKQEIEEAAARVAPYVRTTPVIAVRGLTLKLELMQHTGSFKPRGAFNRILSHAVPEVGVIAASGGNHGLAVAYAARRLGLRAEVFLPTITSPVKVERLRGYGATVTQIGDRYADALEASLERAEQTGALAVHAYDQPEVQAGQGTLARELQSQCPDLDTILVAVGGGGLFTGVASWYTGAAKLVAVEPRTIPTLASAIKAGEPVDVKVSGVAADSLGARRIARAALDVAVTSGAESVLVEDADIIEARRLLWDELRITAEAGGATALAAVISGVYKPEPGERVGVIVCGGNTDPTDLM